MEKKALIGVIIACLVIAALITYLSKDSDSGIESIKSGVKIWTKCIKPDCKAQIEMEKKDYYASVQEVRKQEPMSTMDVPIKCSQCLQMSVYPAVKCGNCQAVFLQKYLLGDSPKCPKCGQGIQ